AQARKHGRRPALPPQVNARLAEADAFGSLGLPRRQALWAAKALGRVGDKDDDLPLFSEGTHNGATRRGLFPSPPELGFTRVRHIEWSKSDISDFDWGGVRGGGPETLHLGASSHHPPPQPSPTASRARPTCAQYCETRASPGFVGEGAPRARCAADHFSAQSATENNITAPHPEPAVTLPLMSLGEEVVNDYRFLELSLRAHP